MGITPSNEYEDFITAHIQATAECITTKPRLNCRVPWESKTIRGKRDSMKKAFLFNKRSPTNTNVHKLKNTQRKPTQRYQKRTIRVHPRSNK